MSRRLAFLSSVAARYVRRILSAAMLSAAMATPALAADPLVSVEWLKAHRGNANVVVLDIRSGVDGGGQEAFAKGHIPGAVHSDYAKAGWRVTRNGVPFMLPTVPELETLIGGLGIDRQSRVVVVPAGVHATDFGSAARIYWTLKTVGIVNVSILNGGFAAWTAAGHPVEAGAVNPTAKVFTAVFNDNFLADLDRVQAAGKSPGRNLLARAQAAAGSAIATLVDARPESFFVGKQKAPAAAAYGHIPGAINVDSAHFYDAANNRLKSRPELAAAAASIPDGPVIAYCNTGHWAATDWFVLSEVLGRKDVRLYDGSMVEWSASPDRPVASSR